MATPHKNDWKKVTPYGNYLDLKQNHKMFTKNTLQYNLVHNKYVKTFYKHAGSKRIHNLMNFINKD